MNTDAIVLLDITVLYPHPNNPRIEPRMDIVEQLAERMKNGFDPSHALIVRPKRIDGMGAYEVISGHHRLLAAERADLAEVPCWVRDLSDDDAYMQLVLCNTQSELHPLEEGKHAAESGMDLKAYAEKSGKGYRNLAYKRDAYQVMSVAHVCNDARDSWRNLAEIHAAPQWLWSALVSDGRYPQSCAAFQRCTRRDAVQPPRRLRRGLSRRCSRLSADCAERSIAVSD